MFSVDWKLIISRVRTMESGERKRREISFSPQRKWEQKSLNDVPHLLVPYLRSGRTHIIKVNGSGPLRWPLK
jgi:hypothetical protein